MIHAGYLTLYRVPALKKKVFLIMSILVLFLDNSEEQKMLHDWPVQGGTSTSLHATQNPLGFLRSRLPFRGHMGHHGSFASFPAHGASDLLPWLHPEGNRRPLIITSSLYKNINPFINLAR